MGIRLITRAISSAKTDAIPTKLPTFFEPNLYPLAMSTRKTPLIARSAASPECSKLIDAMMTAATSGDGTLNPEELANAAFSIMCFGLAKMEDDNTRDDLIRSLPEEAAKGVADIVRISKKIKQERQRH
jgi:hypothetical protein